MTGKLGSHIKQTVSISDDQLAEILSCFTRKSLKKGRHLFKAGQYCNSYVFINSGALRVYYFAKEKEITYWVAFEGHFFTVLESYLARTPSQYSVVAAEDSEILLIDRKNMDALFAKFPLWQEFVRKTWEAAFLKLSNVIRDLQAKNVAEVYMDLAKNQDISQKVKLKDLSTMIGITPFSLSRIRKRKNKKLL